MTDTIVCVLCRLQIVFILSAQILAHLNNVESFPLQFPRSRIYSYRDTPSALLPEFSESHPLTLTNGCTRGRFCLYYTSPVLKFRADELVLLGELSKWIPVSPKRVLDISYDQDDFRVTLTGAAGEVVSFSAVYRQTYLQFHCVLSQAGLAIISFRDTTCRY